MLHLCASKKSQPFNTCFIDHALMYLIQFLPFVPHHLLHRLHCQTRDSGSPALLRAEARCLAAWSYTALSHEESSTGESDVMVTADELVGAEKLDEQSSTTIKKGFKSISGKEGAKKKLTRNCWRKCRNESSN